jgi:hypothetical protein
LKVALRIIAEAVSSPQSIDPADDRQTSGDGAPSTNHLLEDHIMTTSSAQTLAEAILCDAFARYVNEQGLPWLGDAEELLRKPDLTAPQRQWLTDFMLCWNAMLKRATPTEPETTTHTTLHLNTIRAVTAKGTHGSYYFEILKLGPYMCQIDIGSDFHEFQNHARGDVWSPSDLRWNAVTSIHFSLMLTQCGLTSSAVSADDFRDDRNALIRQLIEVLEPTAASSKS